MRSFLFAFSLLSVQAMKLVPQGHTREPPRAKLISHQINSEDWWNAGLINKDAHEQKFDEGALSQEIARKAVTEELDPSDFQLTRAQPSPVNHAGSTDVNDYKIKKKDSSDMKVAFSICMLAAAGVIAMMYWARGVSVVISIAGYLMSLCTMSNMIRNIYVNHHFDYPQFVTACHAGCTCIVGYVILINRERSTGQQITYPTFTTLMTGLGPVAFCFALSLGSANLALLHSNTHFYEMFSSTNILCTFALGWALGRPTSLKLVPCLLVVAVAIGLVAFGELKFSGLGALFVFTGVLFRGFKAQLQSMLMSPGVMSQSFDPVELVCWTSALTFCVMLCWSMAAEGLAPWEKFDNLGVIFAVLVSALNAVILNNAGLFVMREVGPLGQQVIGEMKGVLACLGAVAAFGEVITLQQIVGYTFVVIGAQWYNRVHMQVQEEEQEKTKAAEALQADGEKA